MNISLLRLFVWPVRCYLRSVLSAGTTNNKPRNRVISNFGTFEFSVWILNFGSRFDRVIVWVLCEEFDIPLHLLLSSWEKLRGNNDVWWAEWWTVYGLRNVCWKYIIQRIPEYYCKDLQEEHILSRSYFHRVWQQSSKYIPPLKWHISRKKFRSGEDWWQLHDIKKWII